MDIDLSAIELKVDDKSHRFREAIKVHDGGSVTLGFLTTVVVLKDVFGSGLDAEFGLPNIAVRITAPREGSEPHPRLEWGGTSYENQGRSGHAANYWTNNAATRSAVTTLAFNLPEVGAAVEKYCRMLTEGATESKSKPSPVSGLRPEVAALIDALAIAQRHI